MENQEINKEQDQGYIFNLAIKNFILNKLSTIHTDENLRKGYDVKHKTLNLEYDNRSDLFGVLEDIQMRIKEGIDIHNIIAIDVGLNDDKSKVVEVNFTIRGDVIKTDETINDNINEAIEKFDGMATTITFKELGNSGLDYNYKVLSAIEDRLRRIYGYEKYTKEDSDAEFIVQYMIKLSDFREYLPSHIFYNIIKVIEKEVNFKNVKNILCTGKINNCTERYEIEFNVVHNEGIKTKKTLKEIGCKRCLQNKAETDFYIKPNGERANICKECLKEYNFDNKVVIKVVLERMGVLFIETLYEKSKSFGEYFKYINMPQYRGKVIGNGITEEKTIMIQKVSKYSIKNSRLNYKVYLDGYNNELLESLKESRSIYTSSNNVFVLNFNPKTQMIVQKIPRDMIQYMQSFTDATMYGLEEYCNKRLVDCLKTDELVLTTFADVEIINKII